MHFVRHTFSRYVPRETTSWNRGKVGHCDYTIFCVLYFSSFSFGNRQIYRKIYWEECHYALSVRGCVPMNYRDKYFGLQNNQCRFASTFELRNDIYYISLRIYTGIWYRECPILLSRQFLIINCRFLLRKDLTEDPIMKIFNTI